MKYIKKCEIDSAGRISMHGFLKPITNVVLYATDEADKLFVELYYPTNDGGVESNFVRKIDKKSRLTIPLAFRVGYRYAMIGVNDDEHIVIRLCH